MAGTLGLIPDLPAKARASYLDEVPDEGWFDDLSAVIQETR